MAISFGFKAVFQTLPYAILWPSISFGFKAVFQTLPYAILWPSISFGFKAVFQTLPYAILWPSISFGFKAVFQTLPYAILWPSIPFGFKAVFQTLPYAILWPSISFGCGHPQGQRLTDACLQTECSAIGIRRRMSSSALWTLRRVSSPSVSSIHTSLLLLRLAYSFRVRRGP